MQVKWNNRKNPDRTKGERRKGGKSGYRPGMLGIYRWIREDGKVGYGWMIHGGIEGYGRARGEQIVLNGEKYKQ